MSDDRPRVVYSSGPAGRNPLPADEPGAGKGVESLPPGRHAVRVRAERAGRRGKTVTVAGPLFLLREEAFALLGDLRRRAGSGGTLKRTALPDGRACFELELQGDRVDLVVTALRERGYGVGR